MQWNHQYGIFLTGLLCSLPTMHNLHFSLFSLILWRKFSFVSIICGLLHGLHHDSPLRMIFHINRYYHHQISWLLLWYTSRFNLLHYYLLYQLPVAQLVANLQLPARVFIVSISLTNLFHHHTHSNRIIGAAHRDSTWLLKNSYWSSLMLALSNGYGRQRKRHFNCCRHPSNFDNTPNSSITCCLTYLNLNCTFLYLLKFMFILFLTSLGVVSQSDIL